MKQATNSDSVTPVKKRFKLKIGMGHFLDLWLKLLAPPPLPGLGLFAKSEFFPIMTHFG